MANWREWIMAFLGGALTVALGVLIYLLKNVKPVINADNYIESLSNEIKKLKVKGDGNDVPVTVDVENNKDSKEVKDLKEGKRKFLGVFKRKNKRS